MNWLIVISFLFYTLNITGFRVGRFLLCTSCLKDEPIDLIFWVMYGASAVTFLFAPNVGQWLLLGVFFLFHVIQIVFTYKFWFVRDKDRIRSKVAGYNRFFSHTHHIIKPQENILIPDTFHILLFVMFFVNLTAVVIYILA